jgi:hypothetical protein
MSEKESITSESPFYKVLEHWADEVIEQEKDMPDFCEGVTMDQRFTLKSGMQVRVTISRDVNDEDEI